MSSPSFIDMFVANELITGKNNVNIIEDFIFIEDEYGLIKLSNGTFMPFMVQENGVNKYFTRINIANLKHWFFDQEQLVLYYGNGTDIFNATLNVTRNAA